jgi:hypothetical protein
MNAMNLLLSLPMTLAEIGDNFPTSGKRLEWKDLWAYGVVALVAGFVALIVVQLRNRNDMTKRCDNPWKLFRELCLVHNLDRTNQRLLVQVTRARGFEQPAQVFLNPASFEPTGLPPSLRDKAEQLAKLRSLLF